MPLRYHLVYYAVFVLLLSVAYLVHPLFYIFLLAYLIYLVKRFGRKMLFLLFLLPIAKFMKNVATRSLNLT